MPVERVAQASKATIILLSSSVFLATFSVGVHSHLHALSHRLLEISMMLGFFAFLKIANQVLSRFFFARFVHWIHAMCFEVLALLVIAVLRLFRWLSPAKTKFIASTSLGSGVPILLVHGYCHDSSTWTFIKRQLAKETNSSIYAIDLGYPFHSLVDYANKVKERLEEIRTETGQQELILIGHSMGGVISTMVAVNDSKIPIVFTLASPLNGTRVARIGIGKNAREMECSSELLQKLNEQVRKESKIRFYHIGSKTDQIVIPTISAVRGICPEQEFVFEDLGHASFLFSPRVVRLLVHWLKDANFPSGSADSLCKEDSRSL